MKNLLIFLTVNDFSMPLFLTENIKNDIHIDFCLLSEKNENIVRKINSKKFNYIYIRDPFTDERITHKEVILKVETIIKNKNNSYMVDGIDKMEYIFFEDKWSQYLLFSDVMPKTGLVNKNLSLKKGENYIFKKRISSRGRGISFSLDGIQCKKSSCIYQKRLDIKKEYRVFILFGKIVEIVAVKSSKTENTKIKVVGKKKISKKLCNFIGTFSDRIKFDFVGIDIAEDGKGCFYVLEINRSCLFNAFYNQTGVNLAESFVRELLKK
ncbi:MAG: hypothetical protein PHI66_02990 [Candidatus Pacebacteria bacterium]|nr:hypothetical protein [Candidatus Paceibacterota bacterium]